MGETAAGKRAETELFRKVALEKLASPEQLDQLLRATGARGWLALVAVCALLAVAVVGSAEMEAQRCFGPTRAGQFGLRAHVDVTSAD